MRMIQVVTPLASALALAASAVWAAPPQGQSICTQSPSECSLSLARESVPSPLPSQSDQVTTTSAKSTVRKPNRSRLGPPQTQAPLENTDGNLPPYLLSDARASSEEKDVFVLIPEKVMGALLPGLRAGDILPAELEQSIKASPSVPTPIRARITAGRFRGAYVLGTATLDRELKRVLLIFERLRIPGSDTSYQLKATGLALSGQVGIEGDHHTQEGMYFAAELGAAAAAGYADATTSRSQSILGGYQTEPTAANAAKQGAVQALSKTAERFAERARTAPEYTEIEAGRAIQLIVQEGATEVSGQ